MSIINYTLVLPIAYFPPVSWFKELLLNDAVIEKHENYVKQTLRNRCQIATANGPQRLSLPVITSTTSQAASGNTPGVSSNNTPHVSSNNTSQVSSNNSKIKTTSVTIASHDNWPQKQWNAISTAYGESAFFDYYADDLRPFFTESFNRNLFDHNVSIIRKVLELMEIDHPLCFTSEFKGENYTSSLKIKAKTTILSPSTTDLDASATVLNASATVLDASPSSHILKPYYQVFRQKTGFIPDLSILDLLFNLGPESAIYLLRG